MNKFYLYILKNYINKLRMRQKTLQILTQFLQKDQRLVVDGNFAKNKIIELVLQLDAGILKLLKSSPELRKRFFVEVEDIFDLVYRSYIYHFFREFGAKQGRNGTGSEMKKVKMASRQVRKENFYSSMSIPPKKNIKNKKHPIK